jgi:uncharacterized small protein (DUF1192 family)
MCERHGLRTVISALFGADPEPHPAGPVPSDEQPPALRSRRRRLWELEDKLHCPVIGTCLAIAEIERIARKHGFAGRDFDAYRLHVEAVSLSRSRNPVAESIERLLERKYAPVVRRFETARTDAEVHRLWRECIDRGEVAGALWAAVTHKAASAETRHAVYADMHMLSHQVGASQAAELRRLSELTRNQAEMLRRQVTEAQRQAENLKAERERCQALEDECHRLRQAVGEMQVLRERLAAFESGQVMVDLGRRLLLLEAANADLRAQAGRVKRLEARIEALQEELARLVRERDQLAAERDALERLFLVDEDMAADETQEGCSAECALCPERLRGRCVLCVGGRTPLLAQYRKLAERLGVRLIHHDGGREDAMSRLPELLAASDAVICPTDSVSHAAYGQLKRHCKSTNKPCVLARSSGIAGFAAALARLAMDCTDPRNRFLQLVD